MKIALLGDAAFYGKFSETDGNPKEILKTTAAFLKDFDFVVLNLETPFADKHAKRYGNKSAYIKSDIENIDLLKFLNVNAVCLANNHMFDFGLNSFELTKRLLVENGIDYFGVEGKDLKINLLENKISFSGYCCYSTNPINTTNTGVNPLEYIAVSKKLKKDKSEGYSSILSIHAGQEHVNYPNYDHILLARKLSEINPYVYYGHHPHVLQGTEMINESLVAYSLGNFCFDDVFTEKSPDPLVKMNENNKESALLSLEYKDSKLVGYEVIPIFDGGICIGQKKDQILEKLSQYSDQLGEDKEIYIEKRAQLLNNYLIGRKSTRDINWYLKRLNYNSYRMILNSYKNRIKYSEAVKNHL